MGSHQLIGAPRNGNDQYTKLLFHFDNNYTDSNYGGGAHTVTAQNSPGFDTNKKFGTHAFKGTAPHPAAPGTPARYVEIADHADFTLGTQDFAIDFWVNTALGSAQSTLAAQEISWRIAIIPTAPQPVKFFCSTNGSTYGIQAAGPTLTWTDSTYRHIACVRHGTSFTAYVDGVGGTPVTDSGSLFNSTNPIQLILASGGAETVLYDEFRFSVGTPRQTANFTPSTIPYSRFRGSAT